MDLLLETCSYVCYLLYHLKLGEEEEQVIFQSRRKGVHY